MKIRIEKLSIHQNAKTFAILMALFSLFLAVPFMLFASKDAPEGEGFPLYMVIVFPVLYFVMGYLMTALGCWLYNVMAKYTGGLEFESRSMDTSA